VRYVVAAEADLTAAQTGKALSHGRGRALKALALTRRTGEIVGQTVPRHTSAAFIEFLGDILTAHPRRPSM
jgi:hypothetical protein